MHHTLDRKILLIRVKLPFPALRRRLQKTNAKTMMMSPSSSQSAILISVATTAAILVFVALVSVSAAVSTADAIDGDGCNAKQNRRSKRRRPLPSSRINDKNLIACTVKQPEGSGYVTVAERSNEVAVQPFSWEPKMVRIHLREKKWLFEQPSPDTKYLSIQGCKNSVAILSSSSLPSSFKEAKPSSNQKHVDQDEQLDILSMMAFANGRGLRQPVCRCCI